LSVVLLGLLVMVTRRNAVSRSWGSCRSRTGWCWRPPAPRHLPLVVEISVAFSILIAFIVIGIFLFRIRDASIPWMSPALDDFRGERR